MALAVAWLTVPVTGGLLQLGTAGAEPERNPRPAVVEVAAPTVAMPPEDARPARRVLRTRSTIPARPSNPSVVEATPAPEPVPDPEPSSAEAAPDPVDPAPATTAPPAMAPEAAAPSRVERCEQAIAASGMAPAAGFSIRCGPAWNSGTDGWTDYYCDDVDTPSTCTGSISIHPDDHDSDGYWVRVVRHEIGHSYCIRDRGDFSEGCAAAYE